MLSPHVLPAAVMALAVKNAAELTPEEKETVPVSASTPSAYTDTGMLVLGYEVITIRMCTQPDVSREASRAYVAVPSPRENCGAAAVPATMRWGEYWTLVL